MRTITVASAEPGDVLRGIHPGHPGHDEPLPELEEQVVVEAFSSWHRWRFHARVIGLNHALHTYTVKVGEMIHGEPE